MRKYNETPYLQPLSPFPIHIEENGLIGELLFRYNPEDNFMVISFRYEKVEHELAPIIITVEVTGKEYQRTLSIIDYNNRIVKTGMFCPEYRVQNGIRFCNIRPLVYCERSK
jgi:hypothetical protein